MSHAAKRENVLFRFVGWGERVIKGALFHFDECGQCILKDNGFVCPMRCPKNLRNGPCGGVRQNGHCEVYPDMTCVWYAGITNTQRRQYLMDDRVPRWWMKTGLFLRGQAKIQPPVDWRMHGTSSWINHAVKKNDQFLFLEGKEGLEAYAWHMENEEVD